MRSEIQERLAAVRARQRMLRSLGWLTFGWFGGAVVALVLALLWRFGGGVAWWAVPIAVGTFCLGGWSLGLLLPASWHRAASRVDAHYRLKDRSLTALEFAEDDRDDPLRRLQVRDAVLRLVDVEANRVEPLRRPRWLLAAAGTSAAALAVMLVPISRPAEAGVAPETRRVVREQADYLEETMLEELRELAEENEEAIPELVEQLEKLVEELRDPAVDEREALAALSEMQQSISAAMASFDLAEVDKAMTALAGSMDAAQAMQAIAADLRDEKYDEAAKKLEEFQPEDLSNRESRTVGGNLKKLSKDLEKAEQGQLSEVTAEMAEGLENKNASQCRGAACKLARLCRQQGLRKSLGSCLGKQLSRLGTCKSQCQSCANGCNGTGRSDSPSNQWGTGKTDSPFGEEATRIDSTRQREDLTGTQGDGPSEREVLTSSEGEQQAGRSYGERYRDFRRQAEAVLESEPLPLGHRQTVREYFERIRPTDEEVE